MFQWGATLSSSLHSKSPTGTGFVEIVDGPARKGSAECAEINHLLIARRISTSPRGLTEWWCRSGWSVRFCQFHKEVYTQ
jgi:hypothetical protein